MLEANFGALLQAATALRGPLCVGVDPHPYLLESWGLPDSPDGLREFGHRVIEACAARVAVIKPQAAFFERHGSAGFAALESVLDAARQSGLLVIADVKRGDIGESMDAYAEAWLTPGSTLEADAMTASAYQGVGSLSGAVALARRHNKGLFVLAATSNPEAVAVQSAQHAGRQSPSISVAAGIVEDVAALNSAEGSGYGSFGVVIGATVAMENYGISPGTLAATPRTPILAPGFGFQGAAYSDITPRFGRDAFVLVTVSRSLLITGPKRIADAIDASIEEITKCLA